MKKGKKAGWIKGISIIASIAAAIEIFFVLRFSGLLPEDILADLVCAGLAVLAVEVLLFIRPQQKLGIRGFIGVCMSVVLVAGTVLGNLYWFRTVRALETIAEVTVQTSQVGVYVRTDDPAESLEEIKTYTFGILREIDRETSDRMVELLEEELAGPVAAREYDDVFTLTAALRDGDCDAAIINEAFMTVLTDLEEEEGLEDSTRCIRKLTDRLVETEVEVEAGDAEAEETEDRAAEEESAGMEEAESEETEAIETQAVWEESEAAGKGSGAAESENAEEESVSEESETAEEEPVSTESELAEEESVSDESETAREESVSEESETAEKTVSEAPVTENAEVRKEETTEEEAETGKDGEKAKGKVSAKLAPFKVLLSGIDTENEKIINTRSDVNIIAVVNPETRQVLLVSTPRDYYVQLARKGRPMDKLTHAGIYGPQVSMKTLENLYDTEIDYYFKINYAGFVKIIDSLGGIKVYSEYTFDVGPFHYDKGVNKLNGIESLAFARERYAFAAGDRQRGINQMEVIRGVAERVTSPAILLRYPSLLESIEDTFETTIPIDMLMTLAQRQLDEGGDWEIHSYSVTGTDDRQTAWSLQRTAYVMQPDEESVQRAVKLMEECHAGEG